MFGTFGIKVICISYNIHVELSRTVLFFQNGLSFRTRAAAYRDGCLYWGGISFTIAQPLVPATCLVKNVFPRDSKISLQRTRRGNRLY